MKTGNHRGYLIPTVQTILLALAWLVPTLPVAQVAAVPSGNSAAGLAAFPLKVSANGRYLVDQDNTPFLITGDGPHALIAMLSTADAASYFDNRQADGFNAVWINMLVASPAYYDSRDDGSTYDGIRPFTGYVSGGTDTAHYDLTKPNEAYFARVDRMLTLAAKHSMVVFLDPIDTCCSPPPTRTMWLRVLHINGLTGAGAYGRYLGKRFKRFDNIIWLNGDDFNTWKDPDDDAVVRAVAEGIKAAARDTFKPSS